MKEAEWLTETGAQFEAIELGRAGNMTSQTRGRKVVWKMYINTQQSTSDFHTQGIPEICRYEGSDRTCNNITYYESIGEKENDKNHLLTFCCQENYATINYESA
jgi:hypothetical protein